MLCTLLILAAAVLGRTLAVDLEIAWVAILGTVTAFILLAVIWLQSGGRSPRSRFEQGLARKAATERGALPAGAHAMATGTVIWT